MKLYVIFDPTDSPAQSRFERKQEAVIAWLQAQDFPGAYTIHEHRVGDDADTTLCLLNGEFCFPDPIRAWRGTSKGGMREIEPPRSDDEADRIQAAEIARGA